MFWSNVTCPAGKSCFETWESTAVPWTRTGAENGETPFTTGAHSGFTAGSMSNALDWTIGGE